MAGPASPGSEGPTFAPPQLPAGWIAQWDGTSKKYYYVQLSTGVSQWDTPTEAAPVGGTPGQNQEHPYGVPGQPQIITHPDGSQTVKHADGTMEPVLPPGAAAGDGTRGVDGPTGERGFGSMAMNALLGGKQQHGSSGGHSSSPLGGLANSVIGGLTHSSGGGHSSGGHGSSGGLGGKLVGQLASNLFSSSNKPSQPQNYHGGQNAQPQHSGGFAGSMMGGVAHMFGGSSHQQGQSYGYSNSGQSGGYSGSAPPATYQPPSQQPTGTPSYQSPTPGQHQPQGQHQQQHQNQYPPPPGQPQHNNSFPPPPGQPQHHNSFPPPPGQQGQPYGQQHQTHQYGQPQHNQPYGQQSGSVPPPPVCPPPSQHGQSPAPPQGYVELYGSQPSQPQQQSYQQPTYGAQGGYNPAYGGAPAHSAPSSNSPYPSQPSYANQGPPVPHGSHPYNGQNNRY